MNAKKSVTNGPIQATILKQCVDVYLPFLTKAMNHAITENFNSSDSVFFSTTKTIEKPRDLGDKIEYPASFDGICL